MSYIVHLGDCLESLRTMPDQSVHCCVTSPPYLRLRDYGMEGQIGLEDTPEEFISRLVEAFREVRRVLRDDGTLFLNLGDTYGRDKQRLMIPAKVAIALQADGWMLRDEIVWAKTNCMPFSGTDRTAPTHEMIYMLAKSARYYFDQAAIREPLAASSIARLSQPGLPTQAGSSRGNGGAKTNGPMRAVGGKDGKRNKRSVWSVRVNFFKGAHVATFPPELIEPCVLAGCPIGGTVLDPFAGTGTTAGVALKHGRLAVLCELNPDYAAMIPARVAQIAGHTPDLFTEAAQ